MTTTLKSDIEKYIMFDGIKSGSGIKRETEMLRCKNYINLLEDRIRHLEGIMETKDYIILSHERMSQNPF